MDINWKTGFEIELLAPKGLSRLDLAQKIADDNNGSVKRCFYPQSEPGLAPDTPVFENLILGFDACDASGEHIGKFVDDVTIQQDLDRNISSLPDWYRILSDDIRLLRLIMAQCNPDDDRKTVLEPVAKLFGTKLDHSAPDVIRLADNMNMPVAMAAELPGERERPCEVITPPISENHQDRLNNYLQPAKDLGFTIPAEAAVHIHFDATRLKNTPTFCRLVQTLRIHGKSLKKYVRTNPRCMRLGAMPSWLPRITKDRKFQELDWKTAQKQLQLGKLTKYCDFNLTNFIYDLPGKTTFEVRIFPGSINAEEITTYAALFTTILDWCASAPPTETITKRFPDFLDQVEWEEN